MSYTRWTDCEFYTYATTNTRKVVSPRPVLVLVVSPSPVLVDDDGWAIEAQYDPSEVRNFLSGTTPLDTIPGWSECSGKSRKRLLDVFREYLADAKTNKARR